MEIGSRLNSRRLGKFRPCLAIVPLKPSHRKKEDKELSHEDLRDKFYEQYDKEAKDCDGEFREKYKDDLDVTLIFVRCEHLSGARALIGVVGRSVLCRHFRLHCRNQLRTPA